MTCPVYDLKRLLLIAPRTSKSQALVTTYPIQLMLLLSYYIFTLAKSVSRLFGVICRLRPFFSPSQLLALYRGLIRPCMEYGSLVKGSATHTALLNKVEFKAFRLINSTPLIDCLASRSPTHVLHLYLSSSAIFMLTALLNLLTACLHI